MNSVLGTTLVPLASVGAAGVTMAEDPEGPFSIIGPRLAGDVDDQLLRVIAKAFTREPGVPAKVVNRPGGYGR